MVGAIVLLLLLLLLLLWSLPWARVLPSGFAHERLRLVLLLLLLPLWLGRGPRLCNLRQLHPWVPLLLLLWLRLLWLPLLLFIWPVSRGRHAGEKNSRHTVSLNLIRYRGVNTAHSSSVALRCGLRKADWGVQWAADACR
jgi:hypothetical protein